MRLASLLKALILLFSLQCVATKSADTKAKAAAYEIAISPPKRVTVGKAFFTEVVLTPNAPYKVNLEYPVKLEIQAPKAVMPRQLTLNKAEAREFRAGKLALGATFKANKAGEQQFQALFRFSVCTKELCQLKREKLSWRVSVQQ